ncbi:beta-4C adrenergic receptor-like [Stylophora pistillata]|uniref:beta-4C adrenergic receptor-like n=1 Tax=Stylophora pistillata TaxID=50429 RepID=UPI000C03969B|nr:beta-4C adrenergic receptor-like [Stylophora pistillata]
MAGEFERYFLAKNDSLKTVVKLNCVLNVPLMLITISGNALVLVAVMRTPSIRSPSTIMLCSLAVSDLLVGLAVQPLYAASYLTRNYSLFEATRTLGFIASGVSLFTMTAIAVDRILALHHHLRYPLVMTKSRAICVLATLWIITVLLSCSAFLNKIVYEFTIAITIAISLFTSAVSYVKIFCIVRRHHLQIRIQEKAMESVKHGKVRDFQRSKKGAVNAFIYLIAMILCYTPMFISMSISVELWKIEWILADTLVFINSSINSFLYCWRLRDLRAAVLKTKRQCLCQMIE